jgi:hypothetical protein
MTRSHARGPETPAQALEDMDYQAHERTHRMPAWRRRALYPLSEGVSELQRGRGTDLTGHLKSR